ncbi:hypothetical protein VTH06DRAFT_1213 [Thermothelomyces fergusii]
MAFIVSSVEGYQQNGQSSGICNFVLASIVFARGIVPVPSFSGNNRLLGYSFLLFFHLNSLRIRQSR